LCGWSARRNCPPCYGPRWTRARPSAECSRRRMQPPRSPVTRAPLTGAPPRAGALRRVLYGAAHRARLLASSQWFLAPVMLFLVVLGIVYASVARPPLQAAAVTAITLVPVLTWL